MRKANQTKPHRFRAIQPAGLLLILAFCTALTTSAQDGPPLKQLTYVAQLQKQNGQTLYGFLKWVTDSAVVISPNRTFYGAAILASDDVVPCKDIKRLKFKRSNATGKGALIGAGVGLGAGLIVGSATMNKESTDGFQIISKDAAVGILSIFGVLAGTLVGVIVGATGWHNYKINGDAQKLAEAHRFFDQKVYGQIARTATE